MAALINTIVGHKAQKQWILKNTQDPNLPSSFIFYGSPGVGRNLLARAFLQILNCKQDPLACGHCSSCKRALDKQNEFVYELGPGDTKAISVDSVRKLNPFLSLKTLHPARFVIIDPAELLSQAASNALLKMLEEPPSQTHFFLITSSAQSLLPTLRSRSVGIKFSKLSLEELQTMESVGEDISFWSAGRWDYAQQLKDPKTFEQLNKSLELLKTLMSSPPQDWKLLSPWFFENKQEREFCFHIWLCALHKKLNDSQQEGLKKQALDWIPKDREVLCEIFDLILDFQLDIKTNIDVLLAMENFYYGLKSTGRRIPKNTSPQGDTSQGDTSQGDTSPRTLHA